MRLIHLLFAAILCLQATPALAQKIELDIDKSEWTAKQIELMQKAAAIVYKRMPSTSVAKCAYRHAWRGEPDETKWAKDMATMRRGSGLAIKVIKGTTNPTALGQARIGKATEARHREGFRNLEIRLNDSHINYRYTDKRMKKHADDLRQRYMREEFWAEVIAHEIGHNLGLDHGRSTDWTDAYKGYFITELGACVMNNGKAGSYQKF